MVFFFKQKTAYEMRISDWSSDVCSSDLNEQFVLRLEADGDVPLIADEDGGIDLEELRRQSLQSDDAVGPLRVRLEVVAQTGLDIEEVRDQAAIEDRKSTRLNSSH